MKTVLWKPFRDWTSSMYSNFTSSHRGTNSCIPHTASQDPIVDSNSTGSTAYQLKPLDIEKAPRPGRNQDRNILERAIAQLPAANHTYHPHHAPHTFDSVNDSAEDTQHLAPLVFDPPHQTGINKETTFQVIEADAPRRQSQRKTEVISRDQGPHRPRHLPSMPHHSQDNVTPRAWDHIYSSRHNAPAGLPPSSPDPERVSQNTTAPLTPMSPMSPSSMYSTDVDSHMSIASRTKKRFGGTFFVG